MLPKPRLCTLAADQMPSLNMKIKASKDSSGGTTGLSVCEKSRMISKGPNSQISTPLQTAVLNTLHQNVSSGSDISFWESESNEVNFNGQEDLFRKDMASTAPTFTDLTTTESVSTAPTFIDLTTTESMEFIDDEPEMDEVFSPILKSIEEGGELSIETDPGSATFPNFPRPGAETNAEFISWNNQSCNGSAFFINDLTIANLPFYDNFGDNAIAELIPFPDYVCAQPHMLFDAAEQYMALPCLEDTVKSDEEGMILPANRGLSHGHDHITYFNSVTDEAQDFDPQSFLKNQPELSNVVLNFQPDLVAMDKQRTKTVTLILDLDETLIHASTKQCDDADFTTKYCLHMKEETVYVKKRPHLHTFLEKVSEMFEVAIFTASQSMYASPILDILDPDGKFISRRVYRESCTISSKGCYAKDLTLLGVDLAKVAIIDNTPEVFRLQVNNGIPIKSWYDDRTDNALVSLLPFLETLAVADDVRPIIARKFGNME